MIHRLLALLFSLTAASAARFSIATFEADVTPPIGHPLLASMVPPTAKIESRIWAKGIVLRGGEKPVVLVSVDWCEIRNDAYEQWREEIAKAAQTTRERVLVSCIHQHDVPLADLTAQRYLEEKRGITANIIDPGFHNRIVRRVSNAVRAAKPLPFTHLGLGQAKVKKIGANRRYLGPAGKPRYDRGSATKNVFAREAPEGTIDPMIKALSFWDKNRPIAVLYSYATHPMSFYRTGHVNPDFPGYARELMQKDHPDAMQIYFSGAAGNVTAGKYNDGQPPYRHLLTSRLHTGMKAAWKNTKRQAIKQIDFRSVPLHFKPRTTDGFSRADQLKKLNTATTARHQSRAAMGLSWLDRTRIHKQPVDIPVVDFGPAAFLLLPGETYVEYQLYAQSLRPKDFIMVAGYGESGPGYIPLEMHWKENDSNLNGWCWVARGNESRYKNAIRETLTGSR